MGSSDFQSYAGNLRRIYLAEFIADQMQAEYKPRLSLVRSAPQPERSNLAPHVSLANVFVR